MIKSVIPQTTDLFVSGLHWLNVIAENEKEVRFSKWAKLIWKGRGKSEELNLKRLEWLWGAITSEPAIRRFIGGRLVSLDDEWRKQEPIECAKANSQFGIYLKTFRSLGQPARQILIKPNAEIEILDPLLMKPGKARRLECCDVFGCLKIRIDKLGPKNVEAAALKVDLEDVEIKNNCLYISVKSLNHAYTTASLRLEPHRRSHGGKIYDHIGLKKEEGFVSLEIVRSDYENQMWNKIKGLCT